MNVKVFLSLQHLEHEVVKIIDKHKSKTIPANLTSKQKITLSELIKLKKSHEVRISVSDKGGEFVVMKSTLDDELVKKHLNNRSIYQPTDDLTRKAEKDISEAWEYVAKKNRVNERHIDRLKSTHSICPVLHLLTKTHKFPDNFPISYPDKIKVRPIISGCGGPADKVSWLIQKICTPLLRFVRAHLKSTGQLLQKLRKIQNGELKNKLLFSLDVVSL